MQPDLNLIAIEVTKLCNMKCVMCVSHGAGVYEGQADEQPPFIDFDLFKSIVDEYAEMQHEDRRTVVPQFQGEPMVHPKFLQFCEYLEKTRTTFSFTTNAQKLTEEISRELVKMKYLAHVCFSMDGASKEVYEKIRVLGRYDRVVGNIEKFMALAHEADRSRNHPIRTQISYTEQPLNKHETNELLYQWTPKADFVSINNLATKGRPKEFFFLPEKRIPCGDLWSYMVVLTDGKAVTCCRDYRYEIPVGNVKERGLKGVWFGPEYEELRKLHLAGRWDEIDICNDCDTWMCRVPERKTEYLGHTVRIEVGPFFRSAFPHSDFMDSAVLIAPDATPFDKASPELQDLATQLAAFFPTYFCVPNYGGVTCAVNRISDNLEQVDLWGPFNDHARSQVARVLNSRRRQAPLLWCANFGAARAAGHLRAQYKILDVTVAAPEGEQLERGPASPVFDVVLAANGSPAEPWSRFGREVHTAESFMRKHGRQSTLPLEDQARWSKGRKSSHKSIPLTVVAK